MKYLIWLNIDIYFPMKYQFWLDNDIYYWYDIWLQYLVYIKILYCAKIYNNVILLDQFWNATRENRNKIKWSNVKNTFGCSSEFILKKSRKIYYYIAVF